MKWLESYTKWKSKKKRNQLKRSLLEELNELEKNSID